ncbi:two-component regulator propeller domain-containing protein [Reichenbachiella ulvae]|uniref:histidine kinase n=1 Tax=Reichenbachiella ulvae TaxID=2980104 RepID=A0ABT3CNK7_9BACT|nr:two-component regulator propeller domain-containing protein [Reichenbachiella ulvae]MCV9385187.1 response regulator [Reichenbachiella ulvae]
MKKTIALRLLWGIGVLCTSLPTFSDPVSEEFTFTNIHEGITKRAVTAFSQDEEGFIWIATFGAGLYRYDGLEYKVYKYDWNDSTTISSNVVYEIFRDSQDLLWVVTDNGACYYNSSEDNFQRIEILGKSASRQLTILAMEEDYTGNLLFASSQDGLFLYERQSQIVKHIPFLGLKEDPLFIRDIVLMPDQTILMASNYGLLELGKGRQQIVEAKLFDGEKYFGLDPMLEFMYLDSDENLWIGSRMNGVYHLRQRKSRKFNSWTLNNYPITEKRILSMQETQYGNMLLGTENDGLFLLDKNGKVLQNYYYDKFEGEHIKANSIWSLFKDRDERIWLGYYDKGVGVYDPLFDKFDHLLSQANNLNSLQVASVTDLTQDEKGRYWISMDGGGIDIYNDQTKKFTHTIDEESGYTGLTNKAIQTVFFDAEQNLWAGSWDGGLYFLPKGSKHFKNYTVENTSGALKSNRILSIAEDSHGVIWMGSFSNGLLSYNPKTHEFKSYDKGEFRLAGINNMDIRRVYVDSKDRIWVGATLGLFRIDRNRNGELELHSFSDQMSESMGEHSSVNHILSIEEDSKDNIWIGTDGAGLCQYNENDNHFFWYNVQNGLDMETVCAILEDDQGKIWLSSKSGIASLDLENGRIDHFSTHDGLLSNAFNYNAAYKNKKGQLFFGDFLGVDFFHPNSLKTNQVKPQVFFTELRVFNELVQPNDESGILETPLLETSALTLNHEQSVFTIQFVGLNYTRPEENEYAFYLEGLETDWNYVGNTRSATYTSLKSGDYVFKVKAANNDGVWSDEVRELRITILPPWYRSRWALLVYSISFLGLLYVFFKIVQVRVRDKQAYLTEIENRKQEEELNDKKLQFFTNISHEFRTPLTLILNPLKDVLNDSSLTLPSRVTEKLQVMYKNSDRLQRLIDELMDFRKLKFHKLPVHAQCLEIEPFLRSVCQYFEEEAESNSIDLDVIPNPTDQMVWVDKGMLEKIVFNLLSNAFKVTPQNGSIKMYTSVEMHNYTDTEAWNSLKITISDTGPGLESDQLEKIFERFYQVDKKNKDYFGGTGIGLEVVKDFISLNKGDIKVKSQVGKGTSFELFLRLGDDHLEENEKLVAQPETFVPVESIKELEEQDVIAHGKKKTILIVEDNLELRKYLKSELSKHYRVVLARDGAEGWEMAQSESPDAMVTDVVMPELNGVELCERIKSDIKTSHIPILMLTAKSTLDDQLEGIEKGADAYISKPFDMRLVVSQLAQLIQSRELLFRKYFKGIARDEEVLNQSSSLDRDFVQKLMSYVMENITKPDLSVESLASELNLSRSQLYRKVKALTGSSVNEFTRNIRLEQARKIIEAGNLNIAEVSYQVGFSSPSYFTKCFKEHFGYVPKDTPVKGV